MGSAARREIASQLQEGVVNCFWDPIREDRVMGE